jgi:Ca2+-binding RTX toxin-like protein
MRRLLILLSVIGTALALSSGVALAATIDCPNRADGRCVGTDNNDDMKGTRNVDLMYGFAGRDTLRGLDANDTLTGGIGNDTLYAQLGSDKLVGLAGADVLSGKRGNDRLLGGSDGDPDEFYCGPGTDSAVIEVGDLVQSEAGGLVPVLATTGANDLELITTCERITIKVLH